MSPSAEGLGRELSTAVSRDPARYASAARSFEDLEPTYVRGFLGGLREALKAGKVFAWDGVVALAAWATAQPRAATDENRDDRGGDPHWGWSRKAIADLFQIGFQSKSNEVPFERRRDVWACLAAIVEDPDPTPEHEARYGGENMDARTMSLNSDSRRSSPCRHRLRTVGCQARLHRGENWLR